VAGSVLESELSGGSTRGEDRVPDGVVTTPTGCRFQEVVCQLGGAGIEIAAREPLDSFRNPAVKVAAVRRLGSLVKCVAQQDMDEAKVPRSTWGVRHEPVLARSAHRGENCIYWKSKRRGELVQVKLTAHC
jgi:hypothetical protein